MAGGFLGVTVHIGNLATHLLGRAGRNVLHVARALVECSRIERDVDEAPNRTPRPQLGGPVADPGVVRVDEPSEVAPRRLGDSGGGQRVAQSEDGSPAFFCACEQIELGIFDDLYESSDGFVDAPGCHEIFGLGNTRSDVLAADFGLAETAREQRGVIRAKGLREK
jgi:hypothetical protein